MKRKNIILIAILILTVSFLTILKFVDFLTLPIHIYNEIKELNETPFVIMMSLLIAILIISIIEKRMDFWTVFNFSWVFTLILLVNHYFITYSDYRAFDFYLSKRNENVKLKRYSDDSGWINNEFIVESDTIHLGQNPSINKTQNQHFKIYRSRFQKYYYLQENKE